MNPMKQKLYRVYVTCTRVQYMDVLAEDLQKAELEALREKDSGRLVHSCEIEWDVMESHPLFPEQANDLHY
jgi:hypothetical protein